MIFLLVMIYITFISLGLPDSLFGVSWPVMHLDLNVRENFASIYMIIVAAGSGGTSFFAGPLIRKFGTGRVTFVSVLLTAAGILVVGLAPNIWVAVFGSILLGIGAGAVDSGLNCYVAKHYKASHMNWLHCFWGVGVTVSPLIMSVFLKGGSWRDGYITIACIQFGIAALLMFSLPLWKKYEKRPTLPALKPEEECAVSGEEAQDINKKRKAPVIFGVLKMRGVPLAMLSLGLYCGMEFLLGTWGASYVVHTKSVDAATAAKWISLYYGGIMIGRFICGFLSYKLNDKGLIRLGIAVTVLGIIVLALPIGAYALTGLLLIGIGFGPIFPATIHATPSRFGEEYSADITGLQMGAAYAVGWSIQMCFGFIATKTTFTFMPYMLIGVCALLLAVTEIINKITKSKTHY